MNAEAVFQVIVQAVRQSLPPSISPAYFDGFVRRKGPMIVQVLDRQLALRAGVGAPGRLKDLGDPWTVKERTAANLRAMEIVAHTDSRALSQAEQAEVGRYSGWGGLSIEKVIKQGLIPRGFPIPEARGLIHEYYTPTRVANEVARILHEIVEKMIPASGRLRALEPSAGIGRFIRAFERRGLPIDWTAVEYSPVSSRLLRALLPGATINAGPFERFAPELAGGEPFDLVVSNPPYSERGEASVEDPDPAFKSSRPHIYFLLRTLAMLRPGGVGVYLIPHGFMDGNGYTKVRERLLKSHHLMTAIRLPSEAEESKDPIFPGANLVTDLIFFRRRPAPLVQVPAEDAFIVQGAFFDENPDLILGEERENTEGGRHFKGGYAVIGDFERLPEIKERPMAGGVAADIGKSKAIKARGGITRLTDEDTVSLPGELRDAVALGWRVDSFLADIAKGETERAADGWAELNTDLLTWAKVHGNPLKNLALRKLADERRSPGAQRFLGAWAHEGGLVPALSVKPKHEPRYQGEPTLLGQADWLFRQASKLSVASLQAEFEKLTGKRLESGEIITTLTRAGWCLDGDAWDELVPGDVYLTGDLWPRVDRCKARAEGDRLAADQLAALMSAIKPSVFEDLVEGLSPRESWLPPDVVGAWLNQASLYQGDDTSKGLTFERAAGMLQVEGLPYELLSRGDTRSVSGLTPALVWFLGWANHHLALFRPPQPEEIIDGEKVRRPLDEIRLEISAGWAKDLVAWLKNQPEAQARVEAAYNRSLRGYVAPTFSGAPIHIARWREDAPKLFDYQSAAARRILTNRSGLLAFDVGLGKTYTGIAILARARQEGWVRRPVIVVPNSIVWKWWRDFQRVLPNYRALVIGSNRKVMSRGDRKGRIVSETDTPQERAQKWSAFQAGQADVVLLTYSALGRTKIDATMLETYANSVTAIQRQISINRQRAAERKRSADRKEKEANRKRGYYGQRDLTERQEAVMEEGTKGWLAEHLEATKGQEYDPGIEWHGLGIDFLMIDEAQNFKNLFMPEEREGGIPDAMGGTEESKRAWQLDFRCASVRAHTGGTGIVLLSATPAKNGPVEFYNAIHLIQPKAWESVGISDPETFIDRYCAFEIRQVQTPDGKIGKKLACVAFRNLHELRDVIFRYADFKTAEDVGLKIPDAAATQHIVDLDENQIDAIRALWAEIRELRDDLKRMKGDAAADAREAIRLKIQGIAMKVDLVAIHPDLPGAGQLSRAVVGRIDPHSGKIDQVVAQILATADRVCDANQPEFCLNCGHIVFCEPVAVHGWLKRALVEAGIPEARIAILNAEAAKDAETRQQIAESFNGVGRPGDDEYIPPAYDVVIANSVAYEGVDLQRRTCAIHHLDLPWEPATLQQRNGRGVRQGNHFEAVRLHYYLGKPSGDGRRLSKIQNKRSWMSSLVKSQNRVTNNPAATVEMSVEDLLLDIAPPEERERVLQEREDAAKRLQEQVDQRVRLSANRMLTQANARFRRAERTVDPAESTRLRQEGEAILADLAKLNQRAWPWLALALKVRELPFFVPEEGPPLYPGMRLLSGSTTVEIGHPGQDAQSKPVLGMRDIRNPRWFTQDIEQVAAWVKEVTPSGVNAGELPVMSPESLRVAVESAIDGWGGWRRMNWHLAHQPTIESWWPQIEAVVLRRIAGSRDSGGAGNAIPAMTGGVLRLYPPSRASEAGQAGEVLPPTESGWWRYLELAPESGLKFTELHDAGWYWWRRSLPRDLLSAAKRAA